MEFEFLVGDKEKRLSIDEKEGLWLAKFDDETIEVEVLRVGPNAFWIASSGKSSVAYAAENEGKYYVSVAGRQYCIAKPTSDVRRRSGATGTLKTEELIAAPMPGLVVKVPVSEGDIVKAEQVLVVVESMKMENNIRSRGEARVKQVHVKAGDSVNFGSPLVELEPVSC